MQYTRKDSTMTKGIAIMAMLCLHLFCREGADVLGKPLVWLTETVPAVSWIVFFSEYCVDLYAICAGYGYYLLYEQGRNTISNRLKRVLRLMTTYWIILCLISVIGFICFPKGNIPGSLFLFLQNAVLYRSYCGAWWFLHSYVIMLLLPSAIILWLPKRLNGRLGLVLCLVMQVGWYVVGKTHLIPAESGFGAFPDYVITEAGNLVGIMPAVWAGCIFCKAGTISKIDKYLSARMTTKTRNMCILGFWVISFVGFNLIHKAVLVGLLSVWIFLSFNLLQKPKFVERLLVTLGRHSTNIWLIHMFFYLYLFTGLVEKAKYPLFMLAFMLILCFISSYIIEGVRSGIRFFVEAIIRRKEDK